MRLSLILTVWALAVFSSPAGALKIDSPAYLEQAAELLQAGRHDLARTYLEPALIDFRLTAGQRSQAYYLRGYSFYAQGMYVSANKDYNRALEFHPANPAALSAVAHLHAEGLGVEQNADLAAAFFEQAARTGHPPALLNLGIAYLRGRGVEQDVDSARRLLAEAADAGLGTAMIHLAQSYRAPLADPPQPAQARDWYRKAADAGVTDAYAYLGFMAEAGEGGEADAEAAREYFQQAAAGGSAVAQAKLGHMHLTGEGAAADPDRARLLFEQAADQGHPTAYMGLAYLYETGTAVQADRDQALHWYGKAADAGLVDAQIRMAYTALRAGDLEAQQQAGKWLARAAAQNSPQALNDYAWLLATSPFEQVRNGQQAVTLALQAVSRNRSPGYLDTLAAAYAETGKFDRAVATQREALTLVPEDEGALAAELQSHLDAFESGDPWRE
ncbi:MAG: hypothetical protein U5Q16_03960 [Gammaproteobacteria bacterium]|nr:hypothetical protein [Gammaproteobacteria bacterium]